MPRGRKRTDEQSAVGWQSRPPTKRSCSNHNHYHQSNDCRIPCPFNEKLCLEWFREYTTADEPDLLGPEGMERFCEDIGVEPENVVMLVLAWKMNANSMGFFTREEWLLGMSQLKADSAAVLRTRIDYLRSLLESSDVFKSVYRFAFDFARDKRQRSVDVETGDAMMRLLLGRQWSAFSMFSVFLQSHSGLRVINKDQWTSVLEFSRTVQPGLANYDENGAWPVLLDEFVAWMRHQLPSEYSSTTADTSDQRLGATNTASAATALTVTSTVDVPM